MNSVFDLLTEEEKQLWLDYTEENSDSAGLKNRADISKLLRQWTYCKDLFLNKLFDDTLIFSQPINYKMGMTEKVNRLKQENVFIQPAYRAFCDFVETFTYKDWDTYYILRQLICNFNYYADNKYIGQNISLNYTDENGKAKVLKIQSGTKQLRALNLIYNAFSKDIQTTPSEIEDFQTKISQVLNDTSLTGDLCFSIHPLDYVTASDNECGWTSCMNWRDHGEYHRGTVEMMNSSKVIVVYLKSASDMTICDRKWSNKKWREFFIVTENYIVPIKAYPYFNKDLEKIAIHILANRIQDKGIANGTFNPIKKFCNGCETEEGYNFYFYSSGAMYDDFGSLDESLISYTTNCPTLVEEEFNGISTCIWCGNCSDFDCEGDTICDNCANTVPRCACCGERLVYNDERFIINGEIYCENCYDEYIEVDVATGEINLRDNLILVRGGKDNHITHGCFFCNRDDIDKLPITKCTMENTRWGGHFRNINVLMYKDLDQVSDDIKHRISDQVDFNDLMEDITILTA